MSIETENTPVDDTGSVDNVESNLDDFSAEFFGQKEAHTEEANSGVNQEEDDELDAPENTQSNDEDTVESEESVEAEETPKPKKKQTAQERINEVVGKQREAERQLQAAIQEIERLKQGTHKPEPTKEVDDSPAVLQQGPAEPTPDDKNEDGSDKYPLGEYDPAYIKDLTKFTFQQEAEQAKIRAKEEEARAAQQAALSALEDTWSEKLVTAQERYPDFQEKGQSLISTFEGIDEKYGEYLSATVMSLDHGPDVLYYLANNPELANEIVMSGATKATISLGKLEAMFDDEGEKTTNIRPKVTKAPTPPPILNKGSAVSIPEVPEDTDDLDAFSQKFFKRK